MAIRHVFTTIVALFGMAQVEQVFMVVDEIMINERERECIFNSYKHRIPKNQKSWNFNISIREVCNQATSNT